MLNPADLVRDSKLLADAITAATAVDATETSAATPTQRAALALVAGRCKHGAAIPTLLTQLAEDGLAGKAAAWALGQLDAEAALIAAVRTGSLDVRDNGYYALAVLAARGGASPALIGSAAELVQAEIARAQAKQTGLGEKACRVLAILGAPDTADLIQRVTESDPYTDRFELQRLRKAVADRGKDQESIAEFTAPWTTQFADHLAASPVAAVEPAVAAKPPTTAAKPPAAAPAAGKPLTLGKLTPVAKPTAPTPTPPPAPAAADAGTVDADDTTGTDAAAAPTIIPVDWPTFLASPEAATLTPQSKALITQLGPLLEQLAVRAVNAPLADLAGQELVALLLQVLPQALPPQHVQAALSPHALNGYQALAKFLNRTGIDSHGDQLVQAIKVVRQQLTAQIRQTGMLGGPDYSDPDDAPKKTLSP